MVTPKKTYRYVDEVLPCPDHLVYEQLRRRCVNDDLPQKMATVEKCLAAGARPKDAFAYAFPRLPAFVQQIEQETNVEAVSSTIHFDPLHKPMFSIARDRYGCAIDTDSLYRELFIALRLRPDVTLHAAVRSVAPAVTLQDAIACTKKVSTFSTSFATSAEGRRNNIALALKRISGTVLGPGETFSFNTRVGVRSEDNGFATAKIIVAGEYVEGVGGGVCQVSTTLYNAALLAGMRIDTVRGHTLVPSYVSPSLDAMVNSGSSDLVFSNPFDTPVFILATHDGSNAHVTFFGHALPYKITAVSRTVKRGEVPADREVEDAERKYVGEAPAGTRVRVSYGHPEVQSESFLRYFGPDGKLLREEKIRSDIYKSVQGVVAVAV